jgi:hypothetical protein
VMNEVLRGDLGVFIISFSRKKKGRNPLRDTLLLCC